MSETSCGLDQDLLSGWIDGELTQAEAQRVRLHVERCAACAQLVLELRALRESTRTTRFPAAPEDGWDEAPRGAGSWVLRHTGWLLLALWAAATVLYALWELAQDGERLLEKLVGLGLSLGLLLLFLSVLLDRLHALPSDRYRRVRK